jgi:glutamate-1-semialdehyde 2,1-aminomutase
VSTQSSTFKKSQSAYAEASQLFPGGVNSPVRAFKSVGGDPVFIHRAKGPYLWDVDGNQYIDFVGSWGPAILGHADADVVKRVQEAAENGLSFGAPTLQESQLAHLVRERIPSIEKLRFVSSGTEAVMSAIRLARASTGRSKLIKFEGCYHGHVDSLLVKAGSGALTLGIPDSAGISPTLASETLTATFNDLHSVETLLKQFPEDVASILVEPVAGNMGCIAPEPGFLEGLRTLATDYGALLVFDEVMTGFRVSQGGAQALYGVLPDITALGKVIGGGMPVGAYGAKQKLMSLVAPEGPMYQAGTLSGNPLGMAAGLETLQRLGNRQTYQHLEALSSQLSEGLQTLFTAAGIPTCVNAVGSMLTLFFTSGPVKNYADAIKSDREQFQRFFWGMLKRGIYLPPSQFECWFLSAAHSSEEIEKTLQAAKATIESEL